MRPAALVLILHPEAKTPIFHAMGSYEFDRQAMAHEGYEEARNEWRTPCGEFLSAHHWVDHRGPPYHSVTITEQSRGFTAMRFDNASAIGRPCRRCFPAADA